MADPSSAQRIRDGVEPWNLWRSTHPGVAPDLRGLDLRAVNLRGADLSRAVLSAADLRGADLYGANLAQATLHPQADYRRPKLERADLPSADLCGADLRKADLTEANLSQVKLRGADLRGAELASAILTNADLSGTNLARASLGGADLRWADLRGADLREANMDHSKLKVAKLQGAYLSLTTMRGVDLRCADLSQVDLGWIDLEDAMFDDSTIWPAHLDPPESKPGGTSPESSDGTSVVFEPTTEAIPSMSHHIDGLHQTVLDDGTVVLAFESPPTTAEIERMFPVPTKGGGHMSRMGDAFAVAADGSCVVYPAEHVAAMRAEARVFLAQNLTTSRHHPEMQLRYGTLEFTTPRRRSDRKELRRIWGEDSK